MTEDWREQDNQISKRLGRHVGLNADWSVTAWQISGDVEAPEGGLFLIDSGAFGAVLFFGDDGKVYGCNG